MSAHRAMPVKRDLRDAIRSIIAVSLALAFCLGAGLPVLWPGTAAAASTMAALDCPMHDKRDAEMSLGCICILCAVPGVVAAPGVDPFIIPPRVYYGVALQFATGVSAAHGPEQTANLATGPPAA